MNTYEYCELLQQTEHVATYSVSHEPDTEDKYFPYASVDKSGTVFLPELVYDTPDFGLTLMLFPSLSFFSLVEGDFRIPLIMLFFTFLYFFYVKLRYDVRYFLIRGDAITLMSKKDGTRTYQIKDLKFHLSKMGLDDQHHFEMELPDASLPWLRRVVLLEVTVGRKTMDGILAVLFPLMRGDFGPYGLAKKRGYEALPKFQKFVYAEWDEAKRCYHKRYSQTEELPTVLSHLSNLFEHFKVWLRYYKVNQFLFWLVHGSREKLLAKEQQRGAS
jgi:hypothetical protein